MQKNLLILWACEALKVTHRLPTWPKTSRMNKLHKLRQPAQIVSANWIVLSACPLARAPRWMRRTTEAGLRIHHGTPSICAIFHPRTHVVALVSLAPWAPALAPLAHRVWRVLHQGVQNSSKCQMPAGWMAPMPPMPPIMPPMPPMPKGPPNMAAESQESHCRFHRRFEPGKLCRVCSSSMPDASIIAIPFLTSQSQVRSFGCTPQGSHVEVTAKLTVGSSSISYWLLKTQKTWWCTPLKRKVLTFGWDSQKPQISSNNCLESFQMCQLLGSSQNDSLQKSPKLHGCPPVKPTSKVLAMARGRDQSGNSLRPFTSAKVWSG